MYVKKFDLILLQEAFQAFSPRTSNFMHRVKDELGYDFVLSTPSSLLGSVLKFKPIVDGGLAILSKGDILQSACLEFETKAYGPCRLAAKGCLYALVLHRGSEQGIHVFNAHLQSNYDEGAFDLCVGVRKAQLRELVEFMREKVCNNPMVASREFPVILAGDLNENARPHKLSEADGCSTQEYLDMIEILTGFNKKAPTDLLFKSHKEKCVKNGQNFEHPITHGDTYRQHLETVLTEASFYEDVLLRDSRLKKHFMNKICVNWLIFDQHFASKYFCFVSG